MLMHMLMYVLECTVSEAIPNLVVASFYYSAFSAYVGAICAVITAYISFIKIFFRASLKVL